LAERPAGNPRIRWQGPRSARRAGVALTGPAAPCVCERLIVTAYTSSEPKREHHVPSIIVVANTETEDRIASRDDQLAFQLKERVSASDVDNPHFSSQLIERIGWALADAEKAERAGEDSTR
jgi:hypothetical protein